MAASSPSPSETKLPPTSYSLLLKSFENQPDQAQKLQEFLAHLEKEWFKIEAFKRELPLCMQLLSNAIEASRQQLQSYQEPKPVLEEFIPLKEKHSGSGDLEKTTSISEKSSWMVSAQLWSQSNDGNNKQDDDKKTNHGAGAFLPFTKERNPSPSPSPSPSPTLRILSDLALASAEEDKNVLSHSKKIQNDSQTNNSQAHRKARRCWSPDLHKRFVHALQTLGGSQVATPKQIRELMKVDGLTNDEVKSHLQKYRLHTRRPSPSHQPPGSQGPQLVVLGSIWVPPEYATAAAAAHGGAGPTLYSTHPGSLATTHYSTHQEFYPAPQSHQLHHTIHHPHPHVYKRSSSPESGARGDRDRSESIEDGKSESDSNERGERRGLASLRDEGEKSDGNEITLSF